MQHLAKFLKKSVHRVRSQLKVLKISGGSETYVQNFFKLRKSIAYHAYQNLIIQKKITVPFLNFNFLKLQSRVFLADHTVAMATYCVTKMTTACSPISA